VARLLRNLEVGVEYGFSRLVILVVGSLIGVPILGKCLPCKFTVHIVQNSLAYVYLRSFSGSKSSGYFWMHEQ